MTGLSFLKRLGGNRVVVIFFNASDSRAPAILETGVPGLVEASRILSATDLLKSNVLNFEHEVQRLLGCSSDTPCCYVAIIESQETRDDQRQVPLPGFSQTVPEHDRPTITYITPSASKGNFYLKAFPNENAIESSYEDDKVYKFRLLLTRSTHKKTFNPSMVFKNKGRRGVICLYGSHHEVVGVFAQAVNKVISTRHVLIFYNPLKDIDIYSMHVDIVDAVSRSGILLADRDDGQEDFSFAEALIQAAIAKWNTASPTGYLLVIDPPQKYPKRSSSLVEAHESDSIHGDQEGSVPVTAGSESTHTKGSTESSTISENKKDVRLSISFLVDSNNH